MTLERLRARLAALAAHVPTPTAGRPMTSEQAIRACAAVVEQMKAAGVVVPDVAKPCSRPADPMRYRVPTDGEQMPPVGQRGQSRPFVPGTAKRRAV